MRIRWRGGRNGQFCTLAKIPKVTGNDVQLRVLAFRGAAHEYVQTLPRGRVARGAEGCWGGVACLCPGPLRGPGIHLDSIAMGVNCPSQTGWLAGLVGCRGWEGDTVNNYLKGGREKASALFWTNGRTVLSRGQTSAPSLCYIGLNLEFKTLG